jgi:hypothetical protein
LFGLKKGQCSGSERIAEEMTIDEKIFKVALRGRYNLVH